MESSAFDLTIYHSQKASNGSSLPVLLSAHSNLFFKMPPEMDALPRHLCRAGIVLIMMWQSLDFLRSHHHAGKAYALCDLYTVWIPWFLCIPTPNSPSHNALLWPNSSLLLLCMLLACTTKCLCQECDPFFSLLYHLPNPPILN